MKSKPTRRHVLAGTAAAAAVPMPASKPTEFDQLFVNLLGQTSAMAPDVPAPQN